MEDLDYAGINFGVIAFLYLSSIFLILKTNTKSFNKKIQDQKETITNSSVEQILEAFVFWPCETKKNHKLICLEKVIYIFVIFTNQEVAQSLYEQQNNIQDTMQDYIYKYLYIPIICFGGLVFQKVFYYTFYCFYEECIFKQLEKKYPKTVKFAFSDPRSKSMYYFGYVIANLVVILIVFIDSKDDIFGNCIVSAVISSLLQIFGLELLFVIVFVYFIQIDNKKYTILFQQKKLISLIDKTEKNNNESTPLQ
ncbi:unnamed protein product [Paramecium primaurelia]|uniref:Transmembrane protein n=1 Tax=Paramecium primaurelia TaxID=5886 RepID=A0A8S1N3X5_PARPR|nr:unnamed protein product [Paramecium primaurelia]